MPASKYKAQKKKIPTTNGVKKGKDLPKKKNGDVNKKKK